VLVRGLQSGLWPALCRCIPRQTRVQILESR